MESRTLQPFKAVQVTGSDIKDYKTMRDKLSKQNLVCNDIEKVLIRSAMWFSYGYSDEIDPATTRETLLNTLMKFGVGTPITA